MQNSVLPYHYRAQPSSRLPASLHFRSSNPVPGHKVYGRKRNTQFRSTQSTRTQVAPYLRIRWVYPPEQPRTLQLGPDSGRPVAGVRKLGRSLHHHLAPAAPVPGFPLAAGAPVLGSAQARQRAAAPAPGFPLAAGAPVLGPAQARQRAAAPVPGGALAARVPVLGPAQARQRAAARVPGGALAARVPVLGPAQARQRAAALLLEMRNRVVNRCKYVAPKLRLCTAQKQLSLTRNPFESAPPQQHLLRQCNHHRECGHHTHSEVLVNRKRHAKHVRISDLRCFDR
jgi:hypothetical protein